MSTKKARTEYMKKFKDPKWDSFSKCYEDCVKYRLTRRVMEGSHRPWTFNGWDSSSESSGRSTPRPRGNRVRPLSVAPSADTAEVTQRLMELRTGLGSKRCSEAEDAEADAAAAAAETTENGAGEALANDSVNVNGFHDDTTTDNGPMDSASSDGEALRPRPRQRPRRRPPRSETAHALRDAANGDAAPRKTRAKSQPPALSRDKERLDWTDTHMEARRTPNNSHTSDACVQTGRSKTGLRSLLRRARSADLDKIRKGQLSAADGPWVTEYMRCFSARVR